MTGRNLAARAFGRFGCATAALTLLAACGQSETSEGVENPSKTLDASPAVDAIEQLSPFQTEFVENFVVSCEASAAPGGAPMELVTKICQCAADRVVGQFEESKLTSLTREELEPLTQACIEENSGRGP